MKIYFQQLQQYLKPKLAPCYLISGDEFFLIKEACELIRKAALEQGINDRDYFTVDKSFDWQKFFINIKNLSLFSENKLIELHLTSSKLDLKTTKYFLEYLENPIPEKILLIIAPKLETGWQKTKWIKIIEEKGIFLQVWPLESKQLSGWIANRLRNADLIANTTICNLLAEKSEGNLLAAAQEIEKLALLYKNSTLNIEQVTDAISDNAHYDIFLLVDTILDRDVKKALTILENLHGEGIEPIIILWALTRELRLLHELSIRKNEFERVCQEKKVLAKHIPLLRKALNLHKPQAFAHILTNSINIDYIIKGLEKGNVWRELSLLILQLSGITNG